MAQKRLIIVSGLSGAGRSTALAALSDLGFQASDAVPTSVWPLLRQAEGVTRVAVGWPTSSAEGEEALPELPADWTLTHVFLEADEATLLRRYSEARRVHPFDRGEGLTDALRQERSKAHARRSMADKVIDTTALRLPELRESMANLVEGGGRGPTLRVMSFGYRNGLPPEADLVIDLRWLHNPYYDPALREQTGVDAGVAAYVAADPDFPAFFSDLQQLLTLIVRRQADEGRAYFTIAMGCTGGRHRSVFMAERLGQWLAETGHSAKVVHRDTIIAKT